MVAFTFTAQFLPRAFLAALLILEVAPSSADPREVKFEGSWCRNSCLYGSQRGDEPHLPCQIDFDVDKVRWTDGSEQFERHFVIEERKLRSATLIVEGGNKFWYSHKSKPHALWKFTFDVFPQVPDAALPTNALYLAVVRHCPASHDCETRHSLYSLARKDQACN